jgi:hypothetical protein
MRKTTLFFPLKSNNKESINNKNIQSARRLQGILIKPAPFDKLRERLRRFDRLSGLGERILPLRANKSVVAELVEATSWSGFFPLFVRISSR